MNLSHSLANTSVAASMTSGSGSSAWIPLDNLARYGSRHHELTLICERSEEGEHREACSQNGYMSFYLDGAGLYAVFEQLIFEIVGTVET
jgi:hypothetical protein